MAVNLINYYNEYSNGNLEFLYSQPGGPTIPNPNDPNNNSSDKYQSPGSNNQAPLITNPVTPNQFGTAGVGLLSELSTGGFGSLIGGSSQALLNGVLPGTDKIAAGIKDSIRIGKFLSSPQGIAFNLKQTGLQLMNNFIPHSDPYGVGVDNSNVTGFSFTPNDNRIYNFGINLGTQIPLEAIDIHIERHGSFPSFKEYPDNKGVYSEFYQENEDKFKSSLIKLYDGTTFGIGSELYGYSGGPKSIFGIGRTSHKRWTNTSNDPNRTGGVTVTDIVKPEDYPTNNVPIISTTINGNNPENLKKLKELGISLPTSLGNVSSRTKDQRKKINETVSGTTDKLNLISLLKGPGSTVEGNISSDLIDIYGFKNKPEELPKDLIKFRFEAIDNNNDNNSIFIFFRAFLNGISDRFSPNWSDSQYVGRGEKFYIYGGIDRDISFNFTVAAQTREEMKPIFQKLNFLASNTAPDYNEGGRMRAPFMKLTIGDYLSAVPGFISNLTYTIKDESPWDIALYKNSTIASNRESFAENERQLPHLIDVNIGYKIIHNFLPKKGTNDVFYILPNKDPWISEIPKMNEEWKEKVNFEDSVPSTPNNLA